jgi:hypothetical protein
VAIGIEDVPDESASTDYAKILEEKSKATGWVSIFSRYVAITVQMKKNP